MIITGVMIMNAFSKSIRHGLSRIFKNHHDPACEAYGYTSYPAYPCTGLSIGQKRVIFQDLATLNLNMMDMAIPKINPQNAEPIPKN